MRSDDERIKPRIARALNEAIMLEEQLRSSLAFRDQNESQREL
jgi:hypothetical protein